jgi:tetratricopeptide (TPR) repeat protein
MAGAAESYQQARNLLKGLLDANSHDREVLQALSEVDEDFARVLLVLGETQRWKALWGESTGIRTKLAAGHPGTPDAGARVLWNLAEGSYLAHDWNAAVPAFANALSAYQGLAALNPGNRDYAQQVTLCHRFLCYTERQRKNWDSALIEAQEALRFDTARTEAAPADRDAQMNLSWDWDNIGAVLEHTGDLHASAHAYEQAVAIARKVSTADPEDANAAIYVANWLADGAEAYCALGELSKCLASYRESIDIFDEEFRHDPENTQVRGLYAVFLTEFADLESGMNSRSAWQSAAAMYQRAEELFAPLGPTLNLYEEDMATKADLPRRLALCRSRLANTGLGGNR